MREIGDRVQDVGDDPLLRGIRGANDVRLRDHPDDSVVLDNGSPTDVVTSQPLGRVMNRVRGFERYEESGHDSVDSLVLHLGFLLSTTAAGSRSASDVGLSGA